MWLYPFKNYYLQTQMTREEISQNVLNFTFLSDMGYKPDGNKKYFYGELDPEAFHLQTIEGEDRLVPFTEARMRGVEDEMYLFIVLKAFRYRRIYVVLMAFLLSSFGVFISDLVTFGTAVFYTPPVYLFLSIIVGISIFLLVKCYHFWSKQKNTLDFYRGMFQAELVDFKNVPFVFKL